MEEERKLTPAEKHYLSMKKAQKKYYEKKAGPQEERRSRGRPKKEHWVVETESELLKNINQVKVAEVNSV
jgi:hypothetical protein